jgi:hypothetical protein
LQQTKNFYCHNLSFVVGWNLTKHKGEIMRRLILFTALSMASPLMANHHKGWENCKEHQHGYNVPKWDNCESRFYAEVDYLAWFANVDGNSYGTLLGLDGVEPFTDTFTTAGYDSTDLHFCNKWDSGVRGTIGFKPAKSSWDIGLVYSYFQTCHKPKARSAVAVATTGTVGGQGTILGNVLVPSLGIPVAIPSISTTPGEIETITYTLDPHFKFYFNALDLEIGNEFFTAWDACIRPFIGFRGLWTEYKSHSTFDTTTTFTLDDVSTSYLDTALLKNHNYFNGFGARTGLDIGYELFKGFDVYGSIAGSILWGYINSRQVFDVTSVYPDTASGDGLGRSSVHSSMLNFDFAFGFRWNWWMNCERSLLSIRFGWEQHIFTHINRSQPVVAAPIIGTTDVYAFPTSVSADRNIGRGDLTLSGFVVGVSYTY